MKTTKLLENSFQYPPALKGAKNIKAPHNKMLRHKVADVSRQGAKKNIPIVKRTNPQS
jgi:hypothetical protein